MCQNMDEQVADSMLALQLLQPHNARQLVRAMQEQVCVPGCMLAAAACQQLHPDEMTSRAPKGSAPNTRIQAVASAPSHAGMHAQFYGCY